MGFQLLLKPAFADTHQAQETESQPEPVKLDTSLTPPLGGKSKYLESVTLISEATTVTGKGENLVTNTECSIPATPA